MVKTIEQSTTVNIHPEEKFLNLLIFIQHMRCIYNLVLKIKADWLMMSDAIPHGVKVLAFCHKIIICSAYAVVVFLSGWDTESPPRHYRVF